MEETSLELILSRKTFKEIKWASMRAMDHWTHELKLTWGSRSFCSALHYIPSLPRNVLPTRNIEKGHSWQTISTRLGRCFTQWEKTKVSMMKLWPTSWAWGSPRRSAVRQTYLCDEWPRWLSGIWEYIWGTKKFWPVLVHLIREKWKKMRKKNYVIILFPR